MIMESENVHHQHQLQDQLVGSSSSSLPIPPCYGVSSTHSWTPTSSITLNTEFNPNYNGVILRSRQKNDMNLASPQHSSMIQDWDNNEGSFTGHSCHEQHLAKIKEEFSESLTRFTELLSDTSSIGDSHQLPRKNYSKINDEQKDLHDLSEKLLLKTISSGFPMFSPGSEFYSTTHNCSIPAGNTSLPSRGNFSQIYPSINISTLSQASSPNIPSSSDMNMEALDLLSPARFSRSSRFSHDQNNLDIYKESPSIVLHHHHFDQQSNRSPAYSPSKISPFPTEITEAKRPSILAEPKAATVGAAAKKSRMESRSSCPPFKVRKEKLGDRIAALQQLVAPFGKTDTASVLMEAIGYIKFLQNQVETLSVPYMKSSRNKTSRSNQGGSTLEEGDEEPKRDLRSRGLCLVPLSCMSYVTNLSSGSIWPPPQL